MWLWLCKLKNLLCSCCYCHFHSTCCEIDYEKDKQDTHTNIDNTGCCNFKFRRTTKTINPVHKDEDLKTISL